MAHAKEYPADSKSGGPLPRGADAELQVTREALRKINLLTGLAEDDLTRLAGELRIRHAARRDTVIQKGASGDSLLFLLSGQLQVVDITEDGRAIGLRLLNPGDFFGELAVILGCERTASVVALIPSVVAFLNRSAALTLFSHSPSVANQMLRHLAENIHRDSQFRALLGIHNSHRRVYSFLELLKRTKPGGLETVENLPTHQDIAIMINTSRETVTRAIMTLVQRGIVQKDLHQLIIRNATALTKLSQGS